MFCGFLSIVSSSTGKFEEAAYFIILAGVFDSLSDVVSFGAAPAFMAYQLHLQQWENWGLLISSLLLILGGIRLARFNVQLVGFDKDYFTGLPIPASAIAVIAYVLTFAQRTAPGLDGTPGRMILNGTAAQLFAPMIVIVSLLMVSTVKYDTLPKFSKKDLKKHPVKVGIYASAFVIIIATKGSMLFYLFSAFILYGILRYCVRFVKQMSRGGLEETAVDETEEATSFDL